LLLKKQLEKTSILNSITRFQISIDAGSPEIYSQVRCGGDWKILMDNLEFLANKKRSNAGVALFFVLQQKNYQDVFNFAKICKQFGFSGNISQLDDWGTWNNHPTNAPDAWTIKNGIYSDHNVLDPSHPEWQSCRNTIIELLKTTPPGLIYLSPRVHRLLDLL
jgi:hypothetical protein